jgi:hypothetical protein
MFMTNEVEAILKIPLSRYGHEDLIFWRGTNSGDFSVRSAYFMETERTAAAGGTCSYQYNIFIIWKRIWGIKVPNSLKNFLWGLAMIFCQPEII